MPKVGYLSVDFEAKVAKFIDDCGKAGNAMIKAEKQIAGAMRGINGILGGIGVGLIFKRMIDEATQAENAANRVNAVLRATGGAAGVTAKQVDDLANSYSRLTGIDDDLIKSSEAMLLQFKNIHAKEFPKATEAALNLSVALGIELPDAAKKIGQALNDPKHKLGQLEKAGVGFSEAQKKMIGNLQDTGRAVEAQNLVLKQLEGTIGSVAAAARDTLSGAFKALDTAAGNFLSAILGGDKDGLGGLRMLVEYTTEGIEELTAALPQVGAALGEVGRFLTPIGEVTKSVINASIGGVALVSNRLMAVAKDIAWVAENAMAAGKAILQWMSPILKVFDGLWQGVSKFASAIGGVVGKQLQETFKEDIKFFQTDYVGNAIKAVGSQFEGFSGRVKQKLSEIRAAAARTGTGLKQGIVDPASEAAKEHQKALESVNKIIASLKSQAAIEKAITAGNKEQVMLLQAQEKLAGIKLSDAEKAKYVQIILSFERQISEEKEKQKAAEEAKRLAEKKQEDYKRDLETLKGITDEIDNQIERKRALIAGDADRIIKLEAEERVLKLFPEDEKKRAEAMDQVTAALKRQHAEESEAKYKEHLDAIREETAALEAKVKGKEKEYEIERKVAELRKSDPFLSPEKLRAYRLELINQKNAQAALLEKEKERKETLEKLEHSTASYRNRLKELDKALADSKITAKDYDDQLKKMNDQTLKNVNKSVKDFTTSLADGLTNAITGSQKLSDVLKQIGIQLAKAGVNKFLVQPIANWAGNKAQSFWSQFLKQPVGGAPAVVQQPAGVPVSPTVSSATPGAFATGGLAGPIGTSASGAATQTFDNIGRVASVLDSVKCITEEGEAIRVKIAYATPKNVVPFPSKKLTGGVAKGGEPTTGSNIIPFLQRFEGSSRGGPAWRVIEPDCLCLPGMGKSVPGAASGAAASEGDFNYTPDTMQPLTALLGITGLAGILKALKGLDGNNGLWRLKEISALLEDIDKQFGQVIRKIGDIKCTCDCKPCYCGKGEGGASSAVEDLLRKVIDPAKDAIRVVNPDCPCLPGGDKGTIGTYPGQRRRSDWDEGGGGYKMMTPQSDSIDRLLKGAANAASSLGGGGGFNPLLGSVFGGGGFPLGAAGGGFQAYGNVSGQVMRPDNSVNEAARAAHFAQANAAQMALFANKPDAGNTYLGREGTATYLRGLADQNARQMQAAYQAGNTSYAQVQNYQGAWSNAIATQAAMGYSATPNWLRGLNGGNFQFAGGTGIMGTQLNVEPESNFTPGLTGAVNGVPLFSPYNNGDFSTQAGGIVGPYFNRDANGAIATGIYNPMPQAPMPYSTPAGVLSAKTGAAGTVPTSYMTPGNTVGYNTGIPQSDGTVRMPDGRLVDPLTGVTVADPYKMGYNHNLIAPGYGKNSLMRRLGFAEGGDPPINKPFWVGENGPELMMTGSQSRVVSQENIAKAAAGGAPQVQINNNGHPINVSGQEWDQNGRVMKMTIDSVVSNAPRNRRFIKASRAARNRRTG